MGADPRQNCPHPRATICTPTRARTASAPAGARHWLSPLPQAISGLVSDLGGPVPSPHPAILSRNRAIRLNCCPLATLNRHLVPRTPMTPPTHLAGLSPPSSCLDPSNQPSPTLCSLTCKADCNPLPLGPLGAHCSPSDPASGGAVRPCLGLTSWVPADVCAHPLTSRSSHTHDGQ